MSDSSKIFAIADLHLPLANDIRLLKFGEHWARHEETLATHWDAEVAGDDVVLLPGDISWAGTANRAEPDMAWLGERPGELYISQGNHDRWWRSPSRLEEVLPENAKSVHPTWEPFFNGVIAAVKGMTTPQDRFFGKREERKWPVTVAEVEELLTALEELRANGFRGPSILMMHYPPCSGSGERSEISDRIEASKVDLCVYGHFHRPEEWANTWIGRRDHTIWRFVAADSLGFKPAPVGDVADGVLQFYDPEADDPR